ncbi:cell division protein FtsB [Motilimonas cestriensis]|uniref:Cell division protein FtsB n=1 Tax=Motilimonas cestriensis TaxID=2742685 RepID=A0ABS8WB10_9GAMM|nr:cell division protein FtsB [Motilimonas cestriensis]MCE2596221.1 cell division protein FtsB [Motilimonas cestriensis]
MRFFTLLLCISLALLQYHLWRGKNGLADYTRLSAEVAQQEIDNDILRKRNQRMFADIADLKQGTESVEERARNELGLIKEGEMFFRILPKEKKTHD